MSNSKWFMAWTFGIAFCTVAAVAFIVDQPFFGVLLVLCAVWMFVRMIRNFIKGR